MTKPIEPDFLSSDEEKRKRIDQAGSREDHKGQDVVCVIDHTFVDVESSGLGNKTHNRILKILTEKGAAANNVLRFDYDPQSTLIRLKAVRIHRAGGGVEEVDTDGYLDLPQPQRLMFWGMRMKVLPLPRLEPGDALETEIYSKGFTVAYLDGGSPHDPREEDIIPPMEGVFYEVFLFEETVPVKHKKYTVSLRAGTPLHFGIFNGEAVSTSVFDDEQVRYTFEKKDIPAYSPEPRMHSREEVLTKLVLTTLKDWEDKSRWFFEANETQFDADEDVRRKVAEVTAGKETLEEKATALLRWVAQEIRYIGYAVSKGEGYTIHPGNMIFHERGGVCKESAGMLVTMLRAAGFTSYAALTQSGARVESIPADQFNHCVTALKKPDGSYLMLDPTWAVFSTELFCTAEQEQNYLIGSPEGETLMATPYAPPESSPLDVTMACALDEEGNLTGTITMKAKGRSDTNLRRVFGLSALANLDAWFAKLLWPLGPGTEVEQYRTSDPRDLYKNVEVEMRFRTPRFATRLDGVLIFPSPLARFLRNDTLIRHLEIAKPMERKYDAMAWYTQKVTGEEKLTLPGGFVFASKPYRRSIDHEIVGFDCTVEGDGDGAVRSSETVSFKNRHITRDAYKNFKEGVDELGGLAGKHFLAEKKS
jgi:hypothetical protein